MKIINNLFIILLITLSSCQISSLTDETANRFVAIASQGKFDDKIQVSWIKTKYYADFVVLRSSSENSTYVPISSRIKNTDLIDTDIVKGTTYYYKVQGYNSVGAAMFLTESTKGYAGAGGGFVSPSDITIDTGKSTKSLRLDWKRVDKAVAYEIEKSKDNINWNTIDKVVYLHYIDSDVKEDKAYYYRITSLDKDGIPSPNPSKPIQGAVFSANLGLNSLAGTYSDKIVLTWNKYQYATKYQIFRSEKLDESGTLIKTIDHTEAMEYIDKDVKAGIIYYYYIIYNNDSAINQSSIIRSFLKTSETLGKPSGFTASQATDPLNVNLSWIKVDGATSYEIARSTLKTGPWEVIIQTTETSYNDRVPDSSYTFFYTVTALNPFPGTSSDIKEGWANKPPINITASDSFGEKVVITWDKVENVSSYTVTYSDTLLGTYEIVGSIDNTSSKRISIDHVYDIGSNLSKELFYKIQVNTINGQSVPSKPIKGMIKKIGAPQDIRVINNKTATKSMTIAWTRVDGARSYNIYRAILDHRNSDPNKLNENHFKYLGSSQNASYTLTFNTYPIRRYVYMVKAVDGGGAMGVFSKTDVVWRYPIDLEDFAKDVDLTIIEAQTQIKNFGGFGSSAVIKGRAQRDYDYAAGFSSRNNWRAYSSFEVIINGHPEVKVDVATMGGALWGSMDVTGLYTGKVTYKGLNAKAGGFVFAGAMLFEYNHPEKGVLKEEWQYSKAGALLDSVVLFEQEQHPKPPNIENGHG